MIQNRYLIVQLIGKGGMGEVYLAVDQRLGSAVALKRTYFAGDEMLGNAFEREARILARMRHPVLPKVSDHFGEGDEQFLVMEHISGDDLSKRLESSQKPFPLSWVLFWADQLLDALSYLHSHEPPIIHRDIKPQNLKLTDENHIILLDFGLSKSSTGQSISNSGSSTGSVVGYTPHYAPMEQIRGIGTSPRSDLYSLSATLYQLMTNAVPADALSRADSMLNGMSDPIRPPCEVNPEISQGVSDVILKGMEVSQEKRYANARDMQKVLRKAFTQMQEAMSAHTVAFSVTESPIATMDAPVAGSIQATKIIDSAAISPVTGRDLEPDAASKYASHVTQPRSAEPDDLDATIAFDPVAENGDVRQADVKTEIFLAGGSSLPAPPQGAPVPYYPAALTPAADNFSATTDYSDFSTPEAGPANESYMPEATMPLIAFQNAGESSGEADFYGSPGVTAQPGAFNTVINQEPNYFEPEPAQAVAQALPAKKKSSSGKIFALLGGLAAFFLLVIAGAGGGWYYYTNYYAGAVNVEPSPEPSIEPSPGPEPTVETVLDSDNSISSNSDIANDTNSNSNSNSLSDVLTVGPTPEPTQSATQTRDPAGRPTQPVVRNTPGKQTTPKPTPKPKPGIDILQ